MTTSDMIRKLCERKNISIAELCRRIGQTSQNFNKKLDVEEMIEIANVLGFFLYKVLCCQIEKKLRLET